MTKLRPVDVVEGVHLANMIAGRREIKAGLNAEGYFISEDYVRLAEDAAEAHNILGGYLHAIYNDDRRLGRILEDYLNEETRTVHGLLQLCERVKQGERIEDTAEARRVLPELKECPFCGKTRPVRILDYNTIEDLPEFRAKEDPDYAVVCAANHGGCGAASGYARTEEEAAARWNRRA